LRIFMEKTRRNDPCPCGSGKRFKQCCGALAGERAGSPVPAGANPSPRFDEALALHKAGRLAEAEALYREVLASEPGHAEALHFLGLAAYQKGRSEEAAELIGRAIALAATSQMHTNRGAALQSLGRTDEAIASYRQAVALDPGFADPHYNLGLLYHSLGRHDEAAACFEKVLALSSGHADAFNNLGAALRDMGRPEDAIACYRRAVAIDPGLAGAWNNLGVAQRDLGRVDEAVESYRRALALDAAGPSAHMNFVNLGNALGDQGRVAEAAECFRRALALRPDDAEGYSSYLFVMAYQCALAPAAYLELARGWERSCVGEAERREAAGRVFARGPLAGRRLRVGYVSGDYRRHAVGHFLKTIFALHDRSRVEVFAYSTSGQRDEVTDEYLAVTDHWASLVGIGDAQAAERIRADGIDVLVDVSGHTAHNRLGIFARRAAPVQVHYLGFCASTGLSEMDYWMGDAILTPPEAQAHFSERLWRLPRIWVAYDGSGAAPEPAWRPDPGGHVWVGSFNNLAKINEATLALWAKVLLALPEGRLLLKTKDLADPGNRRRVLEFLAARGVPSGRVDLRDSSATPDWPSHMAYYNRLDVALDPVGGVGGGTTTCDALWMALPLVTLEGDRMASRMTASMLHAIGHPEWIARSEEEYVRKAVGLARDARGREALRSRLRAEVARSPMCDRAGLTRSLEDAYLGMYGRSLPGGR
jgi:predicted O-linked N-acetylglucosamine transferase (SPINDLY family)